jgi:hypothetical protein
VEVQPSEAAWFVLHGSPSIPRLHCSSTTLSNQGQASGPSEWHVRGRNTTERHHRKIRGAVSRRSGPRRHTLGRTSRSADSRERRRHNVHGFMRLGVGTLHLRRLSGRSLTRILRHVQRQRRQRRRRRRLGASALVETSTFDWPARHSRRLQSCQPNLVQELSSQ